MKLLLASSIFLLVVSCGSEEIANSRTESQTNQHEGFDLKRTNKQKRFQNNLKKNLNESIGVIADVTWLKAKCLDGKFDNGVVSFRVGKGKGLKSSDFKMVDKSSRSELNGKNLTSSGKAKIKNIMSQAHKSGAQFCNDSRDWDVRYDLPRYNIPTNVIALDPENTSEFSPNDNTENPNDGQGTKVIVLSFDIVWR